MRSIIFYFVKKFNDVFFSNKACFTVRCTKMKIRKEIYFLSDFHLGAPDREASLLREKHIVKFLDEIKNDASHIFILGDLFDFWYEYKKVVPKGFVRILGKLAELTDSGIIIKFFVGNHDMWMNGYFESELGIEVFHKPQEFEFIGKNFFIELSF